jgi:hypothetical protein
MNAERRGKIINLSAFFRVLFAKPKGGSKMAEEGQEFATEHKQIYRQGAGAVSAQKVEIVQGGCNNVEAQEVVVKQGGIGQAKATRVEVRQGGIGSVDGESVSVIQGGVGIARTKEASLGPGAHAALLIADKVSAQQSGAQVMVVKDSIEMEQSGAVVMVAQRVTAKNSGVVFLLANTVEGDVQAVMDRKTAFTFGAALGAVLGLFLLLKSLLFPTRARRR